MNKYELQKTLENEGYPYIYEWSDLPGTEYPVHAHKGMVALYILNGGLTFTFGKEKVTLQKGDRFDVPVGQEHAAIVGLEGCDFLVGEMIKGDS